MLKDQIVSPPWSLTGSAYILFLHMPASLHQQFKEYKSSLSMCMLVQYDTSPVGPYDELIFIPGLRKYNQKWYWSVSHMLVSSEASVINGRENWGFPKQLAQFTRQKDQGKESVIITEDQHSIAEFHLQSFGPSVPFNSRFFPQTFFKIMQPYNGKNYYVTPQAQMSANLARPQSLKINERFFPNIASMRNLFTLYLRQFNLVFPLATIHTESF
jgi:hypothetical protein